MESIFDIKCFKNVKFWVGQSVYIRIYRNQKSFFKISSPPPTRVPAKAFACICVTIFYILHGRGLLAQGGKDDQQHKKPGPKPINAFSTE